MRANMAKGLGDAMDILDGFRDAADGGQGLKGRAARAVCDAYASNPVAGAMISASNQGFGASMRYGCGPYWQGPDGYDPPTSPDEVPLFTGGQCPGVAYEVFVTRISTTTGQSIEVKLPGTFQGPVTITSPTNTLNQAGDPLENSWQYTVNEGRPDEDNRTSISDGAPTFRVERADGQPDNCGDPEPVFVPPSPGSPPPGRDFGDPRDIGEPGEPYIITPRPPVIGPDGQPTMPVDTPSGPVDFRPDGEEPGPGGEPSIGEPIDVGGGAGEIDEDPDDALTKPTLLGYRYTVKDNAPQFQSVIPGTNPRIYSRVVGSLQLILRGENGTFYSDNLQITSEEGSIVKSHPTLRVVGCVYNVLPNLEGLTLREIRGKDDDS